MPIQSLGPEDPREEEMATDSSILAWRIPWTKEPGRLQSIESQRVRHNRACTHTGKANINAYFYLLQLAGEKMRTAILYLPPPNSFQCKVNPKKQDLKASCSSFHLSSFSYSFFSFDGKPRVLILSHQMKTRFLP